MEWQLYWVELSWFHTSLPLIASPLHHLITACRFRVAALSGHAALAFSLRGIALKLNRSQLCVICRCGHSGENINWLAWHCLPLGLPSAASGACAVEQISPSKRQCGERQASLKAALLYLQIWRECAWTLKKLKNTLNYRKLANLKKKSCVDRWKVAIFLTRGRQFQSSPIRQVNRSLGNTVCNTYKLYWLIRRKRPCRANRLIAPPGGT